MRGWLIRGWSNAKDAESGTESACCMMHAILRYLIGCLWRGTCSHSVRLFPIRDSHRWHQTWHGKSITVIYREYGGHTSAQCQTAAIFTGSALPDNVCLPKYLQLYGYDKALTMSSRGSSTCCTNSTSLTTSSLVSVRHHVTNFRYLSPTLASIRGLAS